MYNILQLSDIHYGADYDGKFDTADQWDAVVRSAQKTLPTGYDAIVITGDIVDDDPKVSDDVKRERYEKVFKDALELRKDEKSPLLVTPGNLDNRAILTEVAGKVLPCLQWGLKQTDGFKDVGGQCLFATVGSKTLVVLDSGTVDPYKGITKLAAHVLENKWNTADTLLFTHKPFQNSRLYHRFMKDNLLPAEVGDLIAPYTFEYFCGHFHHLATVNATTINSRLDGVDVNMHVCPGIQCQIDPYSKDCVAIPIPGYQVITFEGSSNSTVYVHPVIIDDYVVKDKT